MATFKGTGFDTTNSAQRKAASSDVVVFDSAVTVDQQFNVNSSASITGNLTVQGNLIAQDEIQTLIADNFIDLNFGDTATSYSQTGITFNYQAAAAATTINTTGNTLTFSAASAPSTHPKVVAASGLTAGTFSAGDLIQIAGTTNGVYDGIYAVYTNAVNGTVEFKSTIAGDTVNAAFALNDVAAGTETTATAVTLTRVNLMAIRASSSGALEQQKGNTDGDFATYTTIGGTQTLQQTYNNGASITTALNTDIAFTLTSGNFTVDSGNVEFGKSTALTVFEVGATSASIDASLNNVDAIALNASDSAGTISIQNAGGNVAEFKNSSVEFFDRLNGGSGQGRLYRVPTAAADDFMIQLEGATSLDASLIVESNGSGADALKIQTVTNGGGIDINSVAAVTIDASSASNFTVAGAALTLSTTSSGDLNLTAAGNIVATGLFQADGTNGLRFGAAGQTVTSIDTNTSLGTSDTALPTQNAVKTYVDAQVTAQDLDFQGDSGGAQSVDLDSQSLTIAGGTNISTVGSAQTLTVNLDATISLTEVNATNIDASNLRANDGTAAVTIADTNGTVTVSTLLKVDAANGASIVQTSDLTVLSGVGEYELVYISATGFQQADASALSTSLIAGISATDATGGNVANGPVCFGGMFALDIPSGTPAVGDRVYLSETAGKGTLTAPTTAGSVVYQVGFVTNATALGGTIFAIAFVPQFIIQN